jgi:N-acetylmuramoyl-L-alanine amidase
MMRQVTTALAAAAVLLFLQTSPAPAAKQVRSAWVQGDSVNVRKGPGSDNPVIGQVKKGTKVFVLAFNGGWCKVKLPSGQYGWILEKLLQFSHEKGRALAQAAGATPTQPAAGSSAQAAWVKAQAANVRAEPGTTSKDIGTLKKGAKVFIVARKGDWCKVKLPNNVYGWVATWLLTTAPDEGHALVRSTSAVQGGAKAFVKENNVNLRTGPGTSHAKLASLPQGHTVWVLGASGQWRKVRLPDGTTGWMAGWLLKYPGAPAAKPKPAVDRTFDTLPAWIGADPVNVREGPGLDYDVKGAASPGAKVQIVDIEGHWCKVKLPSGQYGWVAGWTLDFSKGEEVTAEVAGRQVDVRVGWVARDEVNLRAGPGTNHKELGEVAKGTEVVILDKAGSWYKVALSNGDTGYMASWLIDTREERIARKEAGGATAQPTRVARRYPEGGNPPYEAGTGGSIVETAMAYRGAPYRRGGTTSRGFDCSGFVQHVMDKHGVSVSHDSRALFNQGTPVSRENLKPGDVVFFENTYRSGISHVGIYIGNGQFIHASNSRGNVKVSDLDSDYYRPRYVGARRMK